MLVKPPEAYVIFKYSLQAANPGLASADLQDVCDGWGERVGMDVYVQLLDRCWMMVVRRQWRGRDMRVIQWGGGGILITACRTCAAQ